MSYAIYFEQDIGENIFKNGPSKICGKEPLKIDWYC